VIPHPHRQKGGGPQLGARGPHWCGPFGTWPDENDGEVVSGSRKNPDEDNLDDGQDAEQGELDARHGSPAL